MGLQQQKCVLECQFTSYMEMGFSEKRLYKDRKTPNSIAPVPPLVMSVLVRSKPVLKT